MKKLLLAAALSLTTPAQAATLLHLEADMDVTTFIDPDTHDVGCGLRIPSCITTVTAPQHFSLDGLSAPDNLAAGQTFSFYDYNIEPHNQIGGTATYLGGGLFQPILLTYVYDHVGYDYVRMTGSTTSFTLTDPLNPAVPEPATWATVLLGLFFIAGALRWRRRPTLAYA